MKKDYTLKLLTTKWSRDHHHPMSSGYTWLMRRLGFTASMLKGAAVMHGLYEEETSFASENIQCFKKFSNALIWWVITGIVATPLISLILTMNNPPGQHVLAITFQSAALRVSGVGPSYPPDISKIIMKFSSFHFLRGSFYGVKSVLQDAIGSLIEVNSSSSTISRP